jgi:hypothetical protein
MISSRDTISTTLLLAPLILYTSSKNSNSTKHKKSHNPDLKTITWIIKPIIGVKNLSLSLKPPTVPSSDGVTLMSSIQFQHLTPAQLSKATPRPLALMPSGSEHLESSWSIAFNKEIMHFRTFSCTLTQPLSK